MQHFLFITFILLFLTSFASYSDNSFLRINEETRNVELAFKTFVNKEKGKSVEIIASFHLGDKAFYDAVRQNITGKTVLYESYGLTSEDEEKAEKQISELGGSVATIFSNPELSSLLLPRTWIYAWALWLGLVFEGNYLKFDTAASLIHADVNKKMVEEENQQNDEELRAILNKKIGFFGLNFPSLCQKTASYAFYCINIASWLLGLKEIFFRVWAKNVKESLNHDPDFYESNDIVTGKLGALIDSPESSNDIAVVYGVKHAPFFEQFLKESGFELEKEEWVVLTSLDQK